MKEISARKRILEWRQKVREEATRMWAEGEKKRRGLKPSP